MTTITEYQLESVVKCVHENSYHGFCVEEATVVNSFKSEMIVEDECAVTQDMLWAVFEDALHRNLRNAFLGDPDDEEPKYSVDFDGRFAFLFVNSFDSKDYFPRFRVKIVQPTYVSIRDVFPNLNKGII